MVERAVARGELPRGTDAELLLFTIAGALVHRAVVERAPLDEGWVERVVDLILLGALPRAAPAARAGSPRRRGARSRLS